jgi:hypothetical protein
MLTETQIDIIDMMSLAIWLGLLAGLGGLLIGALILAIRTRRVFSFLPCALRAMLPSAGIAIGVSLLISLIQMALCKPGDMAGWDVPVWSLGIQAIATFIAGIFGSLITPLLLPKVSSLGKVFGLAVVGAMLGAIANLLTAFDGYFVLMSNVRPIRQAITGFVVGGLAVLLWRLVVGILHGRSGETIPSA